MINIGSVIRKKRNTLGFSQQYLALATEISQAKLSRIESGFGVINFDELIKIADCLQLSLEDLGIYLKADSRNSSENTRDIASIENEFLKSRVKQLELTLEILKENIDQLVSKIKRKDDKIEQLLVELEERSLKDDIDLGHPDASRQKLF